MEKRYVVLHKMNGTYGREVQTDDINEAHKLFDLIYKKIDDLFDSVNDDNIASVTLFDREADIDIKYVELVRYYHEA